MRGDLNALPIAVLRVVGAGHVEAMNGQARQLLSEAVGHAEGDALDAALAPLTALCEPGQPHEVALPHPQRTFRVQSSAVQADGTRLVVLEDVTGFEQTRDERDRLLQLASLSEVMPSILHELKNPLAGISAALELLVEDVTGTHQTKLHAILVEVRRLGLTLDGLGRFRREVRSVRSCAIDVAIREAVSLLSPKVASLGIETRVKVADMPLLPLEAAAIRAVIFNTMMNAMQACKAGAVITVEARFDRASACLHLEVSDTGPGMSPDVLSRATELFFTTKPKGSGIGLALCKDVADAVSGALVVDSSPGAGTRVRLTLPITEKAA